MIKNLEKTLSDLEKMELETSEGVIPAQMYSQMLAIYLYQNELCNAKYLWKRIPMIVKENSTDLKNIWTVAQKMWLRDWPAVYAALDCSWNKIVEEIMLALKERIRDRALTLIGDAYSFLDINTLASMIGATPDDSRQIATSKGWTITGNMVKPSKVCKPQTSAHEAITEDQLYKLTQFVSFLEN
ncbi:COP9 signalosome complex subunit 8 [Nasonia vitripennis]|uniref:CSN8/PSMD8/EIF3K domain-containing protein n=1 Tax=Nasonia vitripennis TaxID=7425 RepID=A0A7M7LMC3_NASVI|nr:COP9 signalosome complex subunit 8 [Nasonia vitripennis]